MSPLTGVPAGGLGFITPFTGVGLHAFAAGWPAGAAAREPEVGCPDGEYASAPIVFDSSVRVAGTGRVDG